MDTSISSKWLHYIALGLLLLWSGFWIFWGVASGIYEEPGNIVYIVLHATPGLVFLASTIIAFRWSVVGGIILLIEGFIVLIGYPILAHRGAFQNPTIVPVIITMALPPIICGILFIAIRRGSIK